jgi:Uma2 family endonuclease
MSSTPTLSSGNETLADLLRQLGDVSPERVRRWPAPGTATVDDIVDLEASENRLYELVDGALVEKVMGYTESRIASILIKALESFIEQDDLGAVTGEGGMFRLPENLVRIPDVAFACWERFPDEEISDDPVPDVVPDLAVEVLSRGNTPGEMNRKLREYFRAGVRLVWFVDPQAKNVTVYTSPTRSKVLPTTGKLDGGKVLPGFELPVASLFAKLKRRKRGK